MNRTMAFVARKIFPYETPSTWFPGHMHKTLKKLQSLSSEVDILIEVRDARIPLTSRNFAVESILKKRNRIIVYNKCDLAIPCETSLSTFRDEMVHLQQSFQSMQDWFQRSQGDIFKTVPSLTYVSSVPFYAKKLLKRIRNMAINGITKNQRVHVYFIGMPNTGKSSILNSLRHISLRRSKAAITGNYPGVTKNFSEVVRLLEHAEVFMLDTPGIMTPSIAAPEDMLKLSLVGCVKEGLIDPVTLVDYLLFRINLVSPSIYAKWSPPTNDVDEFLGNVAHKIGKLSKGGGYNDNTVSTYIIQQYRSGKLGKFMLDSMDKSSMSLRLQHELTKSQKKS
ncbi:GTPase [Schizosaccharomyces cryophilus OY26]|uniref:Mitochondrial GTPase 1 n=1 Tax=Schizosaccharomyces cryophilus (strain OY26 / ATCC MYA-4695 / CBS 11777 / NBRC 106824 / NRRL Y48691) TaxID=653667 RepID=S9XJH4_SCHCR|nr:GTPase [Schizosaccharomyces cryophilus OY26]EPY53841.1 GTPase [Schizosaccharomyces cryophilus OY26]